MLSFRLKFNTLFSSNPIEDTLFLAFLVFAILLGLETGEFRILTLESLNPEYLVFMNDEFGLYSVNFSS